MKKTWVMERAKPLPPEDKDFEAMDHGARLRRAVKELRRLGYEVRFTRPTGQKETKR